MSHGLWNLRISWDLNKPGVFPPLQDDYESIWNVVAFFVAFVCCACQVREVPTLTTHTHTRRNETQPGGTPLTLSLMSTVPPVPVPLGSEETQSLGPVGGCPPLQPLPVWPEKPVAADIPRFSGLPLHRPHPHPQTSGQKQRLRGVSGGGLLPCREKGDLNLSCCLNFQRHQQVRLQSCQFFSDSVHVTSGVSKENPVASASQSPFNNSKDRFWIGWVLPS